MNFLRKIVRKFGFDFHKFRPQASKLDYLRTLNINTVLDIGANIGQFAKEIRRIIPEAYVYSFEPVKECFEELNANMRDDKAFKSFNFALGKKEKAAIINKSSYTPSSSFLIMSNIHKDLFPFAQDHSKEKVTIKKLDDIATDLNLEKEILIKVDVQGFEDKVLSGGINTFSGAKVVLLETSFTPLYEGQPTFDNLYEKLKSLGFKYYGNLQQKVNKYTGEIISEDSIFIR